MRERGGGRAGWMGEMGEIERRGKGWMNRRIGVREGVGGMNGLMG